MQKMKVLIVGGGIGGLTLAAFLEHSHIEYEIIEKCPNWEHQGFVIGLWDNGRDILKKLGLADGLDQFGTRIQAYAIRDGAGNGIRTYDLRNFFIKYGSSLTCINRADLHDWLLSRVDQSKIRMGLSVESIVQDEEGVTVKFTDGTSRVFDAVVGADGAHSVVRKLSFPKSEEKFDNWRVWHTWIDDRFNVPGILTEYVEPSEFAIVLKANGKTHASFIAPVEHTAWDTAEGRAERLRTILKEESALIPASISKHKDQDLFPSDIMEVKLDKWVSGRIALLGDAAHAFGPYAALGGSMAMEDAYVLAGELMKVSGQFPISDTLKRYESKRLPRVQIARELSHKIRLYTLVKSKRIRQLMNLFAQFIPSGFVLRDLDRLLKQEI
ncbi:MAG: Monooxygenase FAD-binding protein [Parcubacteria group bacterium GW2011_GWA2_51_10]|nr:MAG: Monooxygenase FAD-binding protein [Parcubacteria group bacterium GW2011_GWA2_51_10]